MRRRRRRPTVVVRSGVRVLLFAASMLGLSSIAFGASTPLGPTDVGALGSDPLGSVAPQPVPDVVPARRPALAGSAGSGIDVPTRSADLRDAIRERPRPAVIAIPSLGVIAPVAPAGVALATRQLAIPPTAATVVWYRHGPSPGQPGSAVLAGHVDWNGARGAFFSLGSLPPGADISITYDDDTTRRFVVQARRHYPKPDLPVQEIFATTGPPRLTLLTCGGSFDRTTRHYRDNVVVVATPAP